MNHRTRTHADSHAYPTPVPVDHAALLVRLREGDEEALTVLVDRFTPLVRGIVARRCARDDVDDVVQEVWLTLLRRVAGIRTPACLPGWLRQVAMHAALSSSMRRRPVPMSELPDLVADAPDDELVERLGRYDRRAVVRRAVGRLPARDRLLIDLLMASDRPDYRTLSASVGRPVGSIGPSRGRLLRRLASDPDIAGLAAAR